MTDTLADLTEREQELDGLLTRPCVAPAGAPGVTRTAERWSRVVWKLAAAAGPLDLQPEVVARGCDLAARPVFVCGVHRSGTTLMRDLLDDHPALAVLPSEGGYVTGFDRRMQDLPPAARLPCLATEWVRRLANPICREPYWLLGRSTPEQSPYVQFARALAAWWPLVQARLGAGAAAWPLAAAALAYAQHACDLAGSAPPERWAEKTPTSERFLARLRAEFPRAKFIHVVRHPFAVYASYKEEGRKGWRGYPSARRVLEDLKYSYRVALEHSGARAGGDYLLIRYEDLLGATAGTIARVAAHLEIEPLPILMQPTAAGLPTAPNSSFGMAAAAGRIHPVDHRSRAETLTRRERDRVAAAVGSLARALDYDVPPAAGPLRRRWPFPNSSAFRN